MRLRAHSVALAALFTVPFVSPASASAQIGIGAHVGTTGLGGDVAIALGGNAQLRGSLGLMPIEPSWTVSDIDVTAELPSTFSSIGIDFFPGGSGFRIGGGLLIKPDDPVLTAELTGPKAIGNQTYTPQQVGTLTGTIESKNVSPYAMIGFGKLASSGTSLFLDLGAAFVGESTLDLDTSGGSLDGNAQFEAELDREEAEWQEEIDKFKIYPMIRLGLRIGIG